MCSIWAKIESKATRLQRCSVVEFAHASIVALSVFDELAWPTSLGNAGLAAQDGQDNPDLFFGRVPAPGLAFDVLDYTVSFISQACFLLSHHRLLQGS
jgi:hypothetical protein